jgi:ceramide glucosyltransferase
LVGAVVEVLKAVLLAFVGLSLLSTLLSHLFTWHYFSSYERRFPTKGHAPPVSIIKPTKGVDQAALDNFRSFCEQDYPNDYEILFCVEGNSDPSVPVIWRIMQEYPDVDVQLIFSDPEDTRSVGKLKNMIAGYAASSYDVIVFSDSDARATPTFLKETVACVKDSKIGLGFGAPAYEGPEDWGAALMAVSANAFVLRLASMCLFEAFDGAVGTTMVVRREVIEEIGGLEQFGLQVTDDLPLARAIRNEGYRIHLLKQPARVVNRRYGIKRWWSHLHRWLVIIRHYWPNNFWITSLVDLALWWVILRLALSLLRDEAIGLDVYLLAAVLGASVVSASVINLRFVRDRILWRYLWVVPVQELLRLPLVIYSRLTNEILWRGRRLGINSDCTVRLITEYGEEPFG